MIVQDPLGSFEPRWSVGRILMDALGRRDASAVRGLLESVHLSAAVADALRRAAGRGVRCRVLLDAVGAKRGYRRFAASLRAAGVDNAYSVGLGKPARDGDPPVVFVFGEVAGKLGLYRSDDEGRRWQRIDDDAHRIGGVVRHVTGDPRLPGRVYFGTEGRGIWYGDPR